MYNLQMKRVSRHWSQPPDLSRTFFNFPPSQAYIRFRITGQSELWEYEFLIRQLLANRLPVQQALSIFCGHGENEIRLAKLGMFRRCLAVDVSSGAIDRARQLAVEQGVTNIEFICQDLNQPDVLPSAEFDLVIANGALHHSMCLEKLLVQIKRTMKPNAMFLSSEYIGPDHYGRNFRQHCLIKAMQDFLPNDLGGDQPSKVFLLISKSLIRRIATSIAAESPLAFRVFNAMRVLKLRMQDPSEGAQSSKIIDTLHSVFSNVDVRYYGGALLPYVITPLVVDTLDMSNPRHSELVQVLIRLEELAEAFGEISSAHAFLIAWNQ